MVSAFDLALSRLPPPQLRDVLPIRGMKTADGAAWLASGHCPPSVEYGKVALESRCPFLDKPSAFPFS